MRLRSILLVLLCLSTCVFADAPAPESDPPPTWEVGLVGGSGKSFTNTFRGRLNKADLLFVGIHFGKIIHSGKTVSLEYGMEAIPAFVVFQSSTSYGVELTPVLLRWSFNTGKGVTPDIEMGAGMLFSSTEVPDDTSTFNFTPQGGVGVSFQLRPRQTFRLAAKYVHISNAGLGRHNPGFNTVDFVASYHWFF